MGIVFMHLVFSFLIIIPALLIHRFHRPNRPKSWFLKHVSLSSLLAPFLERITRTKQYVSLVDLDLSFD